MTQQQAISIQDKAQLKRALRKDLKAEVALNLFTQRNSAIAIPGRECPYCPQTQQLMEELAELSPKLRLQTFDFYQEPEAAQEYGISRVPAIVLGANQSRRVKFYGMPSGYELAVIIEGIKTISRGVSPLSMDTRKKLRRINHPVHIQVFVTPTDPSCAAMARLAHALGLECEKISADVIEVQEFPVLARRYGIRSVPVIVINEYSQVSGPTPESELVQKILEAGVRADSPH